MIWVLLAVAAAGAAWVVCCLRPVPQTPAVPDRRRRSAPPSEVADLADLVARAAARSRSGLGTAEAWSGAVGGRSASGSPDGGGSRGGAGRAGEADRRSVLVALNASESLAAAGADPARVAVVAAAVQVANEIGAPLAPVLDRIGRALQEDRTAESELRAALAGPTTSARIVGWLPVLGVLIGVALGVDPVAAVVSDRIVLVAALTGALLMVVGHLWIRLLVNRARRWP